jgi:ankyrin repeat protein
MWNEVGNTPLHIAAWHGKLDVVKYLVDNCNGNVEAGDKYGRTPLHFACWNGTINVVKYLIEDCGASIDTATRFGFRAIHYAVYGNNISIVRYLMTNAKRKRVGYVFYSNIEAMGGITPLYIAAKSGYFELV